MPTRWLFSGRIFLIIIILAMPFACVTKDINTLISEAKARLKAGETHKSAEMLNNILTTMKSEIRNHPRHAETWYLFSVSLDKLGKKDLAVKALSRAKKIKQMQAENDLKAKKTENQTQEPEQPGSVKIADTEKVAVPASKTQDAPTGNAYSLSSIKNEVAQNFYRKGAAHLEQGQLQAAADQFLKANEMESGNIELLEKTSEVLDQIGGNYYLKAQKIYSDLARLKGDKTSLKEKIGQARANILSSKPNLKVAEKILSEVLKKNDKNVEAIVLAAQVDSENGKYKLAIKKFEKAIKLDKLSILAYLGLGDCYVKMKDFDKAIKVLNQARGMWPDSFKPLVALGNAYLKNENLGSALQMFNSAFTINQESFEVNLGLLEIFARNNDARAAQHLEICEKIYNGDPRVEYWKAIFLELDEKLLQAKKTYTWLAMYDDEISIKAKIRLGQLYAGEGHKSFPGDLLVKNRPHYAENYRRLENYKLAFRYFQEVMDKNPDTKEVTAIKFWLNENEERIEEATQFESLIQSLFRQ